MLTTSQQEITVSFNRQGSGPALVLVHGSFSNHDTNWEAVMPFFERRFTVYSMARRGRGATSATEGHSVEDEVADAVTVIGEAGPPVFLLGHSYGAHIALAAARAVPHLVRKLVLYEPPWPHLLHGAMAPLESLAQAGNWEGFSTAFFADLLCVPRTELEEGKASAWWPPVLADAKASLGDLRALCRYGFDPAQFGDVNVPTLLQIGSNSPRELYVTDALVAALPNACIRTLQDQAHEAPTTAPELYANAVMAFLDE